MSSSFHESHLATARSFNVSKSISACIFGAAADTNPFECSAAEDEQRSPLGSSLMVASWTSSSQSLLSQSQAASPSAADRTFFSAGPQNMNSNSFFAPYAYEYTSASASSYPNSNPNPTSTIFHHCLPAMTMCEAYQPEPPTIVPMSKSTGLCSYEDSQCGGHGSEWAQGQGQYRCTDSPFSREAPRSTPLTAIHSSASEPLSLQLVPPAVSPPAQQMHVLQLASDCGSASSSSLKAEQLAEPYAYSYARRESLDVPVQQTRSPIPSSRPLFAANGQQQQKLIPINERANNSSGGVSAAAPAAASASSRTSASVSSSAYGSYAIATPPPARAHYQPQKQEAVSPNTAAYAQQLRTTAHPVVAQLNSFAQQSRFGSCHSISSQHSNGVRHLKYHKYFKRQTLMLT